MFINVCCNILFTRPDTTGILSSFYNYILANPDTSAQKSQSAEDREAHDQAVSCIKVCA